MIKTARLLFLLIIPVLFAGILSAQNHNPPVADTAQTVIAPAPDTLFKKPDQALNMGDQFYKVFLITAVILLLLVLSLYIYKKFAGRTHIAHAGKIRIIARQNISPRQSIVIAIIEGKKYILGLSENAVTKIDCLGEVPEEEAAETAAPQPPTFSSVLNRLRNKDR